MLSSQLFKEHKKFGNEIGQHAYVQVKVKQSGYRPGVAQRVPGS
jgi:hypothetical protein